jgi:hypothetical protein
MDSCQIRPPPNLIRVRWRQRTRGELKSKASLRALLSASLMTALRSALSFLPSSATTAWCQTCRTDQSSISKTSSPSILGTQNWRRRVSSMTKDIYWIDTKFIHNNKRMPRLRKHSSRAAAAPLLSTWLLAIVQHPFSRLFRSALIRSWLSMISSRG